MNYMTKTFKIIVLTKKIRDLQENTIRQLNKTRKMHDQNANIIKVTEHKKKNQTGILELKNTITELKKKNSLEGFNSRFDQAGKKINELNNRALEIIESEEQKIREEYTKEESLTNLRDTSKQPIRTLWEF